MHKPVKLSLGIRLSLVQAAMITVVMAVFIQLLTTYVTQRLEKRTERELSQQVSLLVDSMSSYHAALADSADRLNAIFRSYFPGIFTLNPAKTVVIGGIQTATITSGSTVLNLNTDIVDRFTAVTKAVATVFVRSNDDFVRVSSSLIKEDGSRAVGTILKRTHPAYQGLLKGQAYTGKVELFGKDYMSKYLPVKDREGNVIAVLFIGIDFTDGLKALKERIRSIKIARSGYIYALEAQEGKDAGKLLIHPFKEGANMFGTKDANGRSFVQEMLKNKEGIIRYPWINKELGETELREKAVAYRYLKEWNWIIAAGASLDELSAEARTIRNAIIGATLLVVSILLLTVMYISRRWITRPLSVFIDQITDMAQPGSDKQQRLDEKRNDELGLLAVSFNTLMSDMQRREQELSESEIRFRNIFEESPDAHTLICDGVFIDCNRAAEELFQCDRQQFCGRTPLDFSPEYQPDGRRSSAAADENIAEALRTGKNSFEWLHCRLDRTNFWADVTLSVMILHGQTTLFSSLRDISARKLLEAERDLAIEASRAAEARNELLLQTTDQGIYGIDESGCFTYVNRAGLAILGYEQEEIIGRHSHTLIHHSYRDGSRYPAEQCPVHLANAAHASCRVGDELLWRKDGTPISIELSSYPVMQNGIFRGAVVTFSDVTARRQTEETRRKLARAVEQCPVTIMITDTNGTIEFVNPCFSELTGYSAEEAIGQNPSILKSDKTPPEVYGDLWATIAMGKTWEGDFVNKSKDGTLFWEHAVISALINEKGVITHYLAVKEDISEARRIQEELISSRDKAEAATLAKSQFLATMSHEIRTPMNGVIGMTGLLLESDLNDEQRGYAEIVSRSGENLLSLINDILDFSKIEAGRLDMEILNFDLRTTLEDTTELLTFRAHEAGLELICHIDPVVPEYLRGDPGRLRQIITNLAGNAIKFTHTGEVVIGAELASDQGESVTIRFSVRDTGIGIPQSRLAAVFEPFTQADGSTTRKYGGTGLGLAICKQLVELMGGEIGIESEEGKGSTFWFTAQFKKQTLAETQFSSQLLHADIKGTRILVVDDNATNRKLMDALLTHWECSFELAVDGISALERLREAAAASTPFQVVLLDQEMPGMDGSELGRHIKADPHLQKTLMIMVTSLAQRGDAAALEKIGFVGYLAKPVRQSQLYSCIALVLNRARTFEAPPTIVTRHTVAEVATQLIVPVRSDTLHSVRILLAEDNIINQKVAQNILGKLGYKADVVANGLEAVQALKLIDYDLILMDCMMPEMDGFEATAAIRDPSSSVRNHRIPIIAMTANAMQGDREQCLAAGMDDYLAKPVKKDELAAIIEKWG